MCGRCIACGSGACFCCLLGGLVAVGVWITGKFCILGGADGTGTMSDRTPEGRTVGLGTSIGL